MQNDLISRILLRAENPKTIHDMAAGLSPKPRINQKASEKEILLFEQEIKFKLPHVLIEILTKIGNGGFGPGYGLFSTDEMIKTYREILKSDEYDMKESFLPILTWGCDIYSCIDLGETGFPVYYCELGNCCLDDVSFEIENAEGEVVESGTGNPFTDENVKEMGEMVETNILHRNSFESFISDWADGINLESEVVNFDEDEEEEDDED
jgi:hypothetical protein